MAYGISKTEFILKDKDGNNIVAGDEVLLEKDSENKTITLNISENDSERVKLAIEGE